jgi:signal transduction histidine kinase
MHDASTDVGDRVSTHRATIEALGADGSFGRLASAAPIPFAVTAGSTHALAYANEAFERLIGAPAHANLGRPISSILQGPESASVVALLDRVWQDGTSRTDLPVTLAAWSAPLSFTAWRVMDNAQRPRLVVIEAHETLPNEISLARHREIAERMLLSALRERGDAESSESARRRFSFLADAGRRLSESLDETATLGAIAALALPTRDAWCIVDLARPDDTMSRVAITHPDSAKQVLVLGLDTRWPPTMGDRFGLPAMRENAQPLVTADGEAALTASGGAAPELVEVLRRLQAGELLTVPLIAAGRLLGAVTFVAAQTDPRYGADDTELAWGLASRSAIALDRARRYGQALALGAKAEAASRAKSAFLASMSHELRTPLNAIGGFIDLIQMGLRGPVSELQHEDLDRMRRNQRRLLTLIEEVLNLVKVGSGSVEYHLVDLPLVAAVADAVGLVEPLFRSNGVAFTGVAGDLALAVRADAEKLDQILFNLLSNAVKFTPAGGTITVECSDHAGLVMVRVIDTGIGIEPERLAEIFDPFVQVSPQLARSSGGVGLGLAISRELARGMQGDLLAESTPGRGSCFTLMLPRADDANERSERL